MKGTIVSAWIETCRELYGEKVTNESMINFGIDKDKFFIPSEKFLIVINFIWI